MIDVWLPLKILLFPRTTTTTDLYKLIDSLKDQLETIKNIEATKNISDISLKLAAITILSLRPTILSKRNSIVVKKDNLQYWFELQLSTLKILLDNNLYKEAQLFATAFMREYFFLLTLYLFVENILGDKRHLMKVEFEREALDFLLGITQNDELLDIFRKLELLDEFELAIRAYLLSISATIKGAPKETEALQYLKETIKSYSKDNSYLLGLIEKLIANKNTYVLRIMDTILFILNILIRQKIISEANSELLDKIIENLSALLPKAPRYDDLILKTLNTVLEITKLINQNSSLGDIIENLESLGKWLIEQRFIFGVFSERVLLRVPPEIRQIWVPPLFAPINLKDMYITVSVNFVINESLHIVLAPILEIQNLLGIIFSKNQKYIVEFLDHILDSPLASFSLMFLIGSIGAWILENLIMILYAKDATEEKIKLMLELAYTYFLKILNQTQDILEKAKKMPKNAKMFFVYPLYREIYFASLKLTSDIIPKIRRYPTGQKLLRIIEKASTLIESIYQVGPKKQLSMPEELIA